MSDNNTPANPETPAVPETTKQLFSETVANETKDLIRNGAAAIRLRVVNDLVEKELDRRKTATLVVLDKIKAAAAELKKLENSGEIKYDACGVAVGTPTFSKDQLGKIKEAREKIDRLEGALAKAFTGGDFSKLLEFGKGE